MSLNEHCKKCGCPLEFTKQGRFVNYAYCINPYCYYHTNAHP